VRGLALSLLAGLAAFGQDFSKISIDKVDAGFRFTEGAVWSREGFLLFSDVPNNQIRKLVPGERSTVFREDSHGANGNTYDAQGRLYSCESRTRRVVRLDKKGKMEVLAEKWEGKRLNAPNDIVVRKDGQIYFTDPAFGDQADARELDFYGVYHITPKGVMSLIARPAGRPNGIAFSPNGKILYVANSDDRNVRAYDVDGAGAVSNERVAVSNIEGVPDGIRVDEKGNLYVTAKGIAIFNPQGKRLHLIEMHELASNCVFGEADLKGLLVTARGMIYRVRPEVK